MPKGSYADRAPDHSTLTTEWSLPSSVAILWSFQLRPRDLKFEFDEITQKDAVDLAKFLVGVVGTGTLTR
jgi:hypothetical protein